MKNFKNINSEMAKYQLFELTTDEKEEINGGFFQVAYWIVCAVAAAGYTAKNCIDNWQCFKDGLQGRKHDRNNCGH